MMAPGALHAELVEMIGKPLSERYGIELRPLDGDAAAAIVRERLPFDAAALVQVRARDPRMIACLFVRADETTVRLCRELGLEMTLGGTGVVGLLGPDAARLFSQLTAHRRGWLETPSGPRQTKVLLIAGGIAMVSIETRDGEVEVTSVA